MEKVDSSGTRQSGEASSTIARLPEGGGRDTLWKNCGTLIAAVSLRGEGDGANAKERDQRPAAFRADRTLGARAAAESKVKTGNCRSKMVVRSHPSTATTWLPLGQPFRR